MKRASNINHISPHPLLLSERAPTCFETLSGRSPELSTAFGTSMHHNFVRLDQSESGKEASCTEDVPQDAQRSL